MATTVAHANMEAGLVGRRSALAIAAGQVDAWLESEEEARARWLILWEAHSLGGPEWLPCVVGWTVLDAEVEHLYFLAAMHHQGGWRFVVAQSAAVKSFHQGDHRVCLYYRGGSRHAPWAGALHKAGDGAARARWLAERPEMAVMAADAAVRDGVRRQGVACDNRCSSGASDSGSGDGGGGGDGSSGGGAGDARSAQLERSARSVRSVQSARSARSTQAVPSAQSVQSGQSVQSEQSVRSAQSVQSAQSALSARSAQSMQAVSLAQSARSERPAGGLGATEAELSAQVRERRELGRATILAWLSESSCDSSDSDDSVDPAGFDAKVRRAMARIDSARRQGHSAQSAQSAQSARPERSGRSARSVQSAQSVQSARSVRSAQAVQSAQSVPSAQSVRSGQSVRWAQSLQSAQSAQSVQVMRVAPSGGSEQARWSSDPESEEDIFWENEASSANGFADWRMWRG